MLKRLLTGIVIVAVAVGFFFLRTIDTGLFHILISIIALLGCYEMNNMMGSRISLAQKIVSMTGAFVTCLLFYFFEMTGAIITMLVFVMALCLMPVFAKGKFPIESLGLSVLTLLYPTALLIPMMGINTLGDISLFALILTFIISPCADVFAYLVGRTLKGPKLLPEISPNKTISGAIGGLIGGIGGSIAVYAIMRNSFTYPLSLNPYVYFGIVGLVASLLTEIGDLFESYIKRNLGVKDSGIIFPGHGGMLDRVDGLIFASVFIYFVTFLLDY